MLYREANKYIEDFYKTSKNALLLTGARQTGKTYLARLLGKQFRHFIELNFIEHPEAVGLFNEVTSADEIILRLSALTSTPMVPGETLIFFDEVQKCDNLVTAIKFLVDDGRYRYILSGYLLGVELKDIKSQPVGYMGVKEIYPLDFMEFIINMGVADTVISNLRQCWEDRTPVDAIVHEKMMQLFRLYLIVGGMPAAVAEYKESNNVNTVMRVQQDIVALYRKDIAQYAQNDKLKIKEVFDILPSELDAKNKRFILKALHQHAKFERYENSFLWLKDAGVAIPVYNVDEPKVPLKLSETRNLFKLFSNDVGLLAAQYANEGQHHISPYLHDYVRKAPRKQHRSVQTGFVGADLTCRAYAEPYVVKGLTQRSRGAEINLCMWSQGALLVALPITQFLCLSSCFKISLLSQLCSSAPLRETHHQTRCLAQGWDGQWRRRSMEHVKRQSG